VAASEFDDFCRYAFTFLEGQGTRYLVVGGLAVVAVGEPRITADADAIVFLSTAEAESLVRHAAEAGTIQEVQKLPVKRPGVGVLVAEPEVMHRGIRFRNAGHYGRRVSGRRRDVWLLACRGMSSDRTASSSLSGEAAVASSIGITTVF
jgi:hypothetical protein